MKIILIRKEEEKIAKHQSIQRLFNIITRFSFIDHVI